MLLFCWLDNVGSGSLSSGSGGIQDLHVLQLLAVQMGKTESVQQTQHWPPENTFGLLCIKMQVILRGETSAATKQNQLFCRKSKDSKPFLTSWDWRYPAYQDKGFLLEVWVSSFFFLWACFSSVTVIECLILRGHIYWILSQTLL